jgi:hypothetical protein
VVASVQPQIGQKEDQPQRDRHVDSATDLAAEERPVCTENLNPNVVMVKSAKHGA